MVYVKWRRGADYMPDISSFQLGQLVKNVVHSRLKTLKWADFNFERAFPGGHLNWPLKKAEICLEMPGFDGIPTANHLLSGDIEAM